MLEKFETVLGVGFCQGHFILENSIIVNKGNLDLNDWLEDSGRKAREVISWSLVSTLVSPNVYFSNFAMAVSELVDHL